jgi:hypothetical protein
MTQFCAVVHARTVGAKTMAPSCHAPIGVTQTAQTDACPSMAIRGLGGAHNRSATERT